MVTKEDLRKNPATRDDLLSKLYRGIKDARRIVDPPQPVDNTKKTEIKKGK